MNLNLETQTTLRLDPSDLMGNWINSDHGNWGGIARLVVRPDLSVEAFGAGSKSEYEWGAAAATLYSTPALCPRAYGFNVRFDQGFIVTDISAYFNNGILVTTTYNVFTDSSGRSSYWTREFFYRQGSNPWS